MEHHSAPRRPAPAQLVSEPGTRRRRQSSLAARVHENTPLPFLFVLCFCVLLVSLICVLFVCCCFYVRPFHVESKGGTEG